MSLGVFVRGVGARTALGASWSETAARLDAGESAIGPIDPSGPACFDATGFPCAVAAALPPEILEDVDIDMTGAETDIDNEHRMDPDDPGSVERRRGDRRVRMALGAAREAWAAAGVDAPGERIGVFVGAESGRPAFRTVVELVRAGRGAGAGFDYARFGVAARPLAQAMSGALLSPAAVATALALAIGAAGPVETISLACASSAAAIIEAVRALRAGECDVALCGGVGADVDPFMLAGFGLLGALSTRGLSCPFDVRRDGFVVGEGAAMLVLARERGPAAAEIAGVARTLDAHHLTAPDPDGAGAQRAIRGALDDAGEAAVDYVQAHGTSTRLNDAVEARALRAVLGARLDDARVASVKGALGHTIAAAGALGVLCGVEAVTAGRLLPTAGLADPDPECALPHVVGRAQLGAARTALVNSFAFGGANASIVVRRCA